MRSLLFGGLVALSSTLGVAAAGYNSSAYNDPTTGIDFQRWCDEPTGFCFGLALPETVGTDFVGQIVVPLDSSNGWGGVSLGGSMTSTLMIAAWPSGNSVVSSLRKTTDYTNPDVFSGDASLVEIPAGTSVSSTKLTYTFLCKGCILGNPATFGAADETFFLGWALAKTSPKTPASPSSVLTYHSAGFGSFEMLLGRAKSSKYATWAAMAKPAEGTPTGTPSATTPAPSRTPAPSTVPTISNGTYDYIVVGGGAAGIIAAQRLAETNKRVLLIERGSAPTVEMGATNALTWNKTLTPFDVPAVNQALSKLGVIGDYLCPDTPGMAGCVLGGGTIVNAMAYIYPQAADFDDKWPVGWKWQDVESAAARLYERNPGSLLPSADGRRYDQGMYTVLSSFLSGLGWKSVDQQKQPNEKHKAFSHPSWSVANGIRAGPVRSYLPLVSGRDNFTLRLQTKVRRVIRTGGKVAGVELETASGGIEIVRVRAGGKVILAAGALSTPRILFNSGIGPANQIKTVQSGSSGVKPPPSNDWINLPVGQNFKDHPMFTVEVQTGANFTSLNTSSVIPGTNSLARRLYAAGSGIWTQGAHRLQFWTSNVGSDGVTRYYQGSCSPAGNGIISMKVYLTHGATSSGVLGINAAGATTIESEPWLKTDADKEALTQFFQELIDDLKKSSYTVLKSTSAADILASMTSGAHYVGTAKMGPDDGRRNGTSVVDTNAKVYGTDNLFVVDASIHPDLPTGNAQAIVMIAAEAAVARIIALGQAGGASSSIPVSSSIPISSPAQQTAIATSTMVGTGPTGVQSTTIVTPTGKRCRNKKRRISSL
ncbi:putative cellobiose dehydrogenase [Aspergillus clavatus NRRL 1]|uniref:Cellobiose dehydrogenase, putative n=1 Tax=Aspergillus clavatus (strain ATCC 1007 / CBS 513.65 / DSM 816 / NCTC 3887 / NRRL 1 / QM 1276 / 107) TaxID=344612 RepID=A1CFV0_ASPCL|nr:cellobiose dehydrogenase, putative [Aspergillus clavatus NRRL 1]EAW11749.1 cellobiose dehydrogenase, putative [Aspergillus clavatus NRRL 1]